MNHYKVSFKKYNSQLMNYSVVEESTYYLDGKMSLQDFNDLVDRVKDLVRWGKYDLDKEDKLYAKRYREAFNLEMETLGFKTVVHAEVRI